MSYRRVNMLVYRPRRPFSEVPSTMSSAPASSSVWDRVDTIDGRAPLGDPSNAAAKQTVDFIKDTLATAMRAIQKEVEAYQRGGGRVNEGTLGVGIADVVKGKYQMVASITDPLIPRRA